MTLSSCSAMICGILFLQLKEEPFSSYAHYHELRRPISIRGVEQTCGQVLAKGHARCGDPYAIAGYIGTGAKLDRALEKFAIAYAGQVTADYETFRKAVRAGKIKAARVIACAFLN